MHVSNYDTNTGEWHHSIVEDTKPIGPELALDWLCQDNVKQRDESTPCGPLSYSGDQDRFILVSAWSGGRQWYEVVTVFTHDRLSEVDLETILTINLSDEAQEERDDEEEDEEE